MSFANHLFGTVAKRGSFFNRIPTGKSFIPIDGEGGTISIRANDSASWLGLENRNQQKFAYEYCFPVSCVVDRLAELDLTGALQILRAGGKGRGKKNDFLTGAYADRMNKLFKQPNPLQSWEQFRGQQNVYKR